MTSLGGPSNRSRESCATRPAAATPDLEWIAAVVTRRTGLTFPPSRWGVLERAVGHWLATGDKATRERVGRRTLPSEDAWQRLVSLVTVGETYFFRHEEQLDTFSREILPAMLRERGRTGDRRLRVWSAGCSTGEEAHTLAMMLLETIPDPSQWDLRVLGTDIDEHALELARAGRYGRWASRIKGDYRTRWLRATGRGHEVDPAVRSIVSFAAHNLVSANEWPPRELGGPADVILCRNVTMYMAPSTIEQVLAGLYRSLALGGWLFMGPAERAPGGDFVSRTIDGFVFSTRPLEGRPTTASGSSTTRSQAPAEAGRPVDGRTPSGPVPRPPAATSRAPAGRPGGTSGTSPRPGRGSAPAAPTLADALALADAGRLDEAETIARDILRGRRSEPAPYELLATVAEARGDLDAACQALGRVLYLRPGEPVALFRLGLLEWRRGRVAPARIRMRAALEALAARADDALVDPARTITAGAIRGVARSVVS